MTAPGGGAPGLALHIVVRAAGECYAFPVAQVEEAVDAPTIDPVPVAPPGMLGQVRHRGRMLGAWDAGWVFRLAGPAAAGAALVLRDGSRRVAIVVDDVMEMVRIDPADVRAVPGGADLEGVLSGVCLFALGGCSLVNVVRVDALVAMVAPRETILEGVTR